MSQIRMNVTNISSTHISQYRHLFACMHPIPSSHLHEARKVVPEGGDSLQGLALICGLGSGCKIGHRTVRRGANDRGLGVWMYASGCGSVDVRHNNGEYRQRAAQRRFE